MNTPKIYSEWVDGSLKATLGIPHKRCWNCEYRVTVNEAAKLDVCPKCGATMIKGIMQAISDEYNERANAEIRELKGDSL